MDNILLEFVAECNEQLALLDEAIVELESGNNPGQIDFVFRAVHTVKGGAGMLGLTNLTAVAHAAEDVLGHFRTGALEVDSGSISMILEAVDALQAILAGIAEDGQEREHCFDDLINRLQLLAGIPAEFGAANQRAPVAKSVTKTDSDDDGPEAQETTVAAGDETVSSADQITEADNAPSDENSFPAQSRDGVATKETATPTGTRPAETSKTRPQELSIRVNVDVLESLMNLVGELVLTRNQLLQLSRGDEESRYAAPITHLNRVTTDLQEGVMKTRMQPIGNAWSKLPRQIRDLQKMTGRKIKLEMNGAETELDRTVLEAIRDPLTHMVRNSADHGVEPPEARVEKGKSETGTITLGACHEGGHVIITIADDGAGIDVRVIRAKALERGLISEADADRMSDNEIMQLIFRPGFSTAPAITNVSGRGVGMDVVRTSIEKIGGTVDLQSRLGHGTTVRIKIPLTLAIVSALVVKSSTESFAIPQLNVVELVRLEAEERRRIERIHHQEVFRLRDRLLPLIHLDRVIELEPDTEDADDRDVNIVVVQVGDDQFGLIVDEVFDTEEIVVKPVGTLLKDLAIYQGTTILGDGRVIMILDVAGIASEIGGVGSLSADSHSDAGSEVGEETTTMLVFDAGAGSTMAVPLSLVSRLEEFQREQIETAGDQTVAQYRGDLLPLMPVHGQRTSSDRNVQPVIVFSDDDCSMGLLVDQIEDIIEEQIEVRMKSDRAGVLGTAIVNGRATEIVDTRHYLLKVRPDWFNRTAHVQTNVLLAEDSSFFRQLATTNLEALGMHVTAVDNGRQAMAVLERNTAVDVVVSDLDMPEMDGFELAQWVRSRPQYSHLPLIGLSGNVSSSRQQQAQESGFNRLLRKFDAAEVKAAINDLCGQVPVAG